MANKREYLRKMADSKIGKIVIDRDLCIAVASCIAVSPATFELDQESKAIVINPDAEDDETVIAAAESCPTRAIFLFDKNGKQIFPK